MYMIQEIENEVLEIIKNIKSLENLKIDEPLIDSGLLDSFDLIHLITILENTYLISIPGSEIVPENLNKITDLSLLVRRLKG
jgi:acyl carrier protein